MSMIVWSPAPLSASSGDERVAVVVPASLHPGIRPHINPDGLEGGHVREGSVGCGEPNGKTYHSGWSAPNFCLYHST